MSEYRIIKKYPNRRLYDTQESRYITLTDVRKLVIDELPFSVIDQRTNEDITRCVLLQVISEQEGDSECILTQDFLFQMIRAYSRSLPGFAAVYLEQSFQLLLRNHNELYAQLGELPMQEDPLQTLQEVADRTWNDWVRLQKEFLNSLLAHQAPASFPDGSRPRDVVAESYYSQP